MNVNTAGMTDLPKISSTAPAKGSGNRDTEAFGIDFQKVIDQFADKKETRSEKPKDDEYIDPRTLKAHLKSEDDAKAEEERLKAMMSQAETVAVQMITPEMLQEVAGDSGKTDSDGAATAIDSNPNSQSANQTEILSDQELMTDAGNPMPEEIQSEAGSILTPEQLAALKDSSKTLNYESGNAEAAKTSTDSLNQSVADQSAINEAVPSAHGELLRANDAAAGHETSQQPVHTMESQINGTAGNESEPKMSRKEMTFETTDGNRQIMGQENSSKVDLETRNLSSESLQNAQQALSESTGSMAASQAAVVSDKASASDQMETQPLTKNSQPAIQNLQSDPAETSTVQDQAMAKAAAQSGTSGEQESGFADMLKNQSSLAKAAKTTSDSEAAAKTENSALSEVQASLEELKKNAEAKGVNLMDRMAEARLMGGAKVQTLNQTPGHNGANVVSQLKDGLELGMKNQLKEFTIHLKPEGLGEVIINMVSQDGKLTVNIGASNADTQKLINSQMMNLKEMLEPLHAEVGQVYHSSQESTGFLSYGQNMSENQRQQTSRFQGQPGYGTYTMEDEEILTEAEYLTAQSRMARLYTYV